MCFSVIASSAVMMLVIFLDVLRTVYTTIVPVVPIARLKATVFSKVCETVRFDISIFSHTLIT